MLVASANPEDYTNRGRMITPLKDRFGSQIRTHYPLEVATEMDIVRQEARPSSIGDVHVQWPEFMEEIITTISHVARSSSQVNQRSGVSVRLSVSNYETLAANAVRRALRVGETDVAPRVSDLAALAASTSGKIEIESMEEGRESQILENFVKAAVLQVFKKRVSSAKIGEVIALFEGGVIAHTGEDIASAQYVELFNQVPPLRELVVAAVGKTESVAQIASGVDFVLEGLHLSKRLNKDESGSRATYRSRT
jgi:magnesium chelatase subunit I